MAVGAFASCPNARESTCGDLSRAGEAPDFGKLLKSRGWQTKEEAAAAVAERYGRDLADPSRGKAWRIRVRAALTRDRVPEAPLEGLGGAQLAAGSRQRAARADGP
jgi:hypothetical protein